MATGHRIAGLDSVRALSFLAVFLTHAGLLPFGFLGVSAFFVLSGYLIIPILIDMREGQGIRRYLTAFYGRRALRIFPLYFGYLAVALGLSVLVLQSLGPVEELERFRAQFVWAATYTYDFYHATAPFEGTPLLTHFWSLAVEEQFYLVAPLAIWFVRGRGLLGLLWLTALTGPLLRFGVIHAASTGLFGITGSPDIAVWVLPFAHLDAFAIGGLAALAGTERVSRAAVRGVGLLAAGGMLIWILLSHPWHFGFLGDGAMAIWGYSLFSVAMGALLMELRSAPATGEALDRTPLGYLGVISYGLYVLHVPVIWVVQSTIGGARQLVIASVSLGLTVAIAALSFHLMERPALRLKDRFFPRHASPRPSGG